MAYAQQAKYVFYFIGDGMGVNQVNGTEMYLAEQEGDVYKRQIEDVYRMIAITANQAIAAKKNAE